MGKGGTVEVRNSLSLYMEIIVAREKTEYCNNGMMESERMGLKDGRKYIIGTEQ
jgi:hypothetical protein